MPRALAAVVLAALLLGGCVLFINRGGDEASPSAPSADRPDSGVPDRGR